LIGCDADLAFAVLEPVDIVEQFVGQTIHAHFRIAHGSSRISIY